jgi:dolichol-phosphate mannosyltransferase
VPVLVERVLAQDPRLEMLFVDDSSPDGTGDLIASIAVENPRVHLLRRPGKMGLGTAYRDGFRWALARDYELIFEMDADFSHDPDHLPEFLKAAEDADFVLGSRYLNGKVTVVNWPMSRLVLSYGANIYARLVTGMRLWDATGGFKCFHRRVLEAIDLDDVRSNGYAFQIEMSFRAMRKGFKPVEIPIVFADRTEGESKMSGHIVREAIFMVWRLRWWALTGRV